jgi:hypothetical protein
VLLAGCSNAEFIPSALCGPPVAVARVVDAPPPGALLCGTLRGGIGLDGREALIHDMLARARANGADLVVLGEGEEYRGLAGSVKTTFGLAYRSR